MVASSEGDLFGRTLRMIAVLVGACVLFVGALSAAAVVITNKAVGSPTGPAAQGEVKDTSSTAPKKPLSI
jgi:hypothetical protein